MVSKLDKKRLEITKMMESLPAFKKSTRGEDLYNAKDAGGDTVKVQFKGNNFKVSWRSIPVFSKPMKDLPIEKLTKYLNWRLERKLEKSKDTPEIIEESENDNDSD